MEIWDLSILIYRSLNTMIVNIYKFLLYYYHNSPYGWGLEVVNKATGKIATA